LHDTQHLTRRQCLCVETHVAQVALPLLVVIGAVATKSKGIFIDGFRNRVGSCLFTIAIIGKVGSILGYNVMHPFAKRDWIVINALCVTTIVIVELKPRGCKFNELKGRLGATIAITQYRIIIRGLIGVLEGPERPAKVVVHGHSRNDKVGAYNCAATIISIEAQDHATFRVVEPGRTACTQTTTVGVGDGPIIA